MMKMNPGWKACLDADDRAKEICAEAEAQALKEWEKAVAPATEIYNIAIVKAWNICQETMTKNSETFDTGGPIFGLVINNDMSKM